MIINDKIEINDNVCGGKPTIRGMRITVQTILELLSAGNKPEEILAAYPMLESEDITASLSFASQLMSRQFQIKPVA